MKKKEIIGIVEVDERNGEFMGQVRFMSSDESIEPAVLLHTSIILRDYDCVSGEIVKVWVNEFEIVNRYIDGKTYEEIQADPNFADWLKRFLQS